MADPYINPANYYEAQHDGSGDLAINNTYIRRSLARLAFRITAKFFHRDGRCVPISKHKILKTGYSVHLTEAATMKYVSEHTSIPVPKVHCSFLHKNRAYVIMERIQGEDLASAWKNLSKESLQKIFSQLKDMIQELRALEPPPGTGVESCVGGSLYDSRLPHGTPRFGPFKTTQEFHRWLRHNLEATQIGDHVTFKDANDIRNMIAKQEGRWPSPVFTHCDLNPFNILISGDKVVGIIDWESSGWYPPYWEFTTAWFGNMTRTEWQGILHTLLDAYPEELEMERTRNKWWGEW
ncbi:kinase-like protein [Trematosphaeria pertusa]|uniref:Kinase-like protein n=1 Tax=Trematosphaeria pertusa TaxID=390896 RepID=A0A6A6I684_9PLEO|nr:kinase-like protein [Trematosphaeria pertusa]KAF2245043.1 kinase-like protein [Trematosphaeria pertusa]